MLKSLVKAIGVVACLALPCAAYAIGMGGINVSSALGEPLKAEIELVAVSKAEKGRLTARLASPEAYKSAGMDYPSDLSKLKFQIETRANGEPYLKLTTAQPLNEPFISVLVELSWPSGKLLREYTFLLDPPEFKAKQPEAAEVKPVAPVAEMPEKQDVTALQPPPSLPQEEKAPVPAAAEPSIAVAPLPAAKPAEPATTAKPTPAPAAAHGAIKVKRGDTLSQIALDSRPSGVSLERMLLALYRANTEAFDGNNMNRLKAGKILRVPEQDEINKATQAEAAEEFRAHVADWNEYRQKLAAASSARTEQPVKQETSGKITAAIADKTSAATESPKEVVKLSKGEAPGDKSVASGSAKNMQEKTHTLEEEAFAKEKTLKESSERVALLEKNIKEMQRLIDLKGQPPAAPAKPAQAKTGEQATAKLEAKPEAKIEPQKTEAQKAETKPAAPAPVTAPQPPAASATAAASAAVDAASTVKPAKPAPKAVPTPVPVAPPPPSLLDEPLLLAGGAAALVALGGLGIMVARRRKGSKLEKKKTPEIAEIAGAVGAAEIAESAALPEAGDFMHAATQATPPQTEEVDPLSEADLFLNFGRDVQAEEILKDALAKNPASNPIRLKLLSIYANRKDTNSFSVIARQVESSGDAEAWAQAAEIGRNIDPGNPMYGGSTEPPPAPASELQPTTGLDFDLGLGEQKISAVSGESAAEVGTAPQKTLESTFTGLDFDLDSGAPEEQPAKAAAGSAKATESASGKSSAAQPTPTDFDVSGSYTTPATEAEKTTLDDLVFDITGSHPDLDATESEKTVTEADIPASGEDTGLAFTLDFPAETQPEAAPAPAPAREAMDFDLSSINLNLETSDATPSAEPKDAHWHDVATKLDLARAYQEMGDNAGAREILEEVIAEGDEQQRTAAEAIKKQLLV